MRRLKLYADMRAPRFESLHEAFVGGQKHMRSWTTICASLPGIQPSDFIFKHSCVTLVCSVSPKCIPACPMSTRPLKPSLPNPKRPIRRLMTEPQGGDGNLACLVELFAFAEGGLGFVGPHSEEANAGCCA